MVVFEIYPNNENYHFGTMRKTTILGPGSEVPGQPPGPRGHGGPGTSEPGPKMVVFRMVGFDIITKYIHAALGAGPAPPSRVPKWSVSHGPKMVGFIVWIYFKNDHG